MVETVPLVWVFCPCGGEPYESQDLGFILVGIGDLVMEFVLIPDAMSGSSEEIARNIGHTIGKIVRMIYPVILLVFMTKPEVKRVLS